MCVCVCGKSGCPCLFHLLLGWCWHLCAMCVAYICVYGLSGRRQRGTAQGDQTQEVTEEEGEEDEGVGGYWH